MAEITKQVSANADDGYTYSSTLYVNDSYDTIGNFSGNTSNGFFRFSDVQIPNASDVISAKLQLLSQSNLSGATCNLKIHFEAADNPSSPSSFSDYNARSLTTGTNWNAVPSMTAGSWYDSVDITSDLQAVFDRPGWASGNALIAYVKNNSSSTNAYRQIKSHNSGAANAVKLVIEYVAIVEADETDVGGLDDAVDGDDLKVEIADAAGVADTVDGYDLKGEIADGAGTDDTVQAYKEISAEIADQAGAGDSVATDGTEIYAQMSDGCAGGDSTDAVNWTTWLGDNRDQSVIRYYCTITGSTDGTTDIEVPISSFQARKRNGNSTYLSVVIPGVAYADQITARSNGDIVIDMAYVINGSEAQREEIVRAELEQINIQEGPSSRSITLVGHKDQTFVAKESRLYDPIYKAQMDGALSYRFATPDLWLNPGDTAQVGDDEFTVETVIYTVSAGGGQTTMEVQESA